MTFYSVAANIGIGALVGVSAGAFYRLVISPILGKFVKYRQESFSTEQERLSMRTGFWQSTKRELVWPQFALSQWKLIKQYLGKNYSTTLKIYLNNPVNGQSVLTGILHSFEDLGTPYDMVIFPKYKMSTQSQSIVDVLEFDSTKEDQVTGTI